MNQLNDLARELARLTDYEWKVGRGMYRCPHCGSVAVARERNQTTRYPERSVEIERVIRCMDCGEEESEDQS